LGEDTKFLLHSPYSPDINPCDSDGITRIKRGLKGTRFNNETRLFVALTLRIDELNESGNFSGINGFPEKW
jgi:hypothetical protein